jgi:hypothetical protein
LCSTPQSRPWSNFFITFQPNFYHKIPILHTSINDFTTFTTFYHIFRTHKRNEHKILSRRKDSEQSCESNENPLGGHSKRVCCYNFAFKTFTKVIPSDLFWPLDAYVLWWHFSHKQLHHYLSIAPI